MASGREEGWLQWVYGGLCAAQCGQDTRTPRRFELVMSRTRAIISVQVDHPFSCSLVILSRFLERGGGVLGVSMSKYIGIPIDTTYGTVFVQLIDLRQEQIDVGAEFRNLLAIAAEPALDSR